MEPTTTHLAAAVVVAAWAGIVTPALVQHDVLEHRLPNRLTLPGWWVAGIVLAVLGPVTGEAPIQVVLGAATLAVALGALALAGGLGMGDVKLAVPLAVGLLLLHPRVAIVAGLLAALSGTIVGISEAVRQRNLRVRIPFGPPMLLGYWSGYAWFATGLLP